MKAYKYIIAATIAAASLSSCSDEKESFVGEGLLMVKASISSDLTDSSRSTQEELEAELGESFEFYLSTPASIEQGGAIKHYSGLSNLPEAMSLPAGSYIAEAWAGDSVSASFDKRFFKAYETFEVESGNTTTVNMNCKIANVVVSVECGEGVLDNYQLDSIYVYHKRGGLAFKANANDRGYFMMPSNATDLDYIYHFTRKGGNEAIVEGTGTLKNVKPAHEYKFKLSFVPNNPEETHVGGTLFDIELNVEEEPVYDEVKIYSAPSIQGVFQGEAFDIDETFTQNEDFNGISAYITASSEIKNVNLTSSIFTSLSLAQSFDLCKITNSTILANIQNAGITWSMTSEASGNSNMMINFSAGFIENLQWETEQVIEIQATDDNGLTCTKQLKILKTAAPVSVAAEISAGDVNAPLSLTTNSFVVTGDVLTELEGDVYVNYEEDSSTSRASLKQVKAEVAGGKYTAELTDLTPNTKYTYYITVGSYTSPTSSFVTEPETQLPNSSFEEWQVSSTPYLVYAEGSEMYWDSGNHGSAKANTNITVPESNIKHSGNYSISLNSQKATVFGIGKFAAGNVFIGEYLATVGTNGVIGWGRPFTGRPTKLKGYVKYTPVTVDNESSSFDELKIGDMDEGIIYWGLLDETLKEYDGKQYPVIINTKTKELFDPNGDNVIAYGEMIFKEATNGDGLVEFEIPLTYKRTDVRPSYIMCTAAASRGGDYFVGGAGSTMILDDLELVY